MIRRCSILTLAAAAAASSSCVAADLRRPSFAQSHTQDAGAGEQVEPAQPCEPDAGAFYAMVQQANCSRDADCIGFNPTIYSLMFACCYAMRKDVYQSDQFQHEWNAVSKQCGHVNMRCSKPCDRVTCVAGTCKRVDTQL